MFLCSNQHKKTLCNRLNKLELWTKNSTKPKNKTRILQSFCKLKRNVRGAGKRKRNVRAAGKTKRNVRAACNNTNLWNWQLRFLWKKNGSNSGGQIWQKMANFCTQKKKNRHIHKYIYVNIYYICRYFFFCVCTEIGIFLPNLSPRIWANFFPHKPQLPISQICVIARSPYISFRFTRSPYISFSFARSPYFSF